jgi:hypothetical protein
MRKHIGFAVTALAVLGLILFGMSSQDETAVADALRPKAGTPYVAPASSFLPSNSLQPLW